MVTVKCRNVIKNRVRCNLSTYLPQIIYVDFYVVAVYLFSPTLSSSLTTIPQQS